MYPLVVVSKKLTGWLAPQVDDPSLSRDDFHVLAKMGQQEGVINADEAKAMSALLAFRGLVAKDIMTPRTVMASLPADMTVGEVSPTDPSLRFSRIPIFQDHSEDFIGFVRKDELFKEASKGRRDTKLSELKRDFLSILEGKSLPELMQTMVDERVAISLVVSEYGDPLGIATMEDLVETMLGMEIVDESDSHIDMQERARQLWRLRANTAGIKVEHKE
jgi:CBS domain containing-hemolysin-like protein